MTRRQEEEAVDRAIESYSVRDNEAVALAPSRREHRPTWPVDLTRDQVRAQHADVSPVDLLRLGAEQTTALGVDWIALVALCIFDHATLLTPFVDAAGQQVASLHSQLVSWRRTPGGLATIEVRPWLVRNREPIPIP